MNKLLKGGMLMLGLMAGCSPKETTAAPVASVEVAKGKVAVVYFSWGGNTRFAAETIAKILPPKAFAGSSVKSSATALETFVTDRVMTK